MRALFNKMGLEALYAKAEKSLKKRGSLILHSSREEEPYGTLLTLLCPNSYVQPHTHPEAAETFQYFFGHTILVTFDEQGNPINYHNISQDKERIVIVPKGTYHTLLVKDEPAVIKTVYQGLYEPETYKQEPDWAPQEGADKKDIQKYLKTLCKKLKAMKHDH